MSSGPRSRMPITPFTPLRRLRAYSRRHQLRTLRSLSAYMPYSAGTFEQLSELTLQAAQETPHLLSRLAVRCGAPSPQTMSTNEFWTAYGQPDVTELESLFRLHGSDKSTSHDYHLVYGTIFADLGPVNSLLEIGLGTNNEDVPSHMSAAGRPGASLRAFRDYLPTCNVYGADLDARILFSEERICTFQVDQTSSSSVQSLSSRLPQGMDVMIDDGLHSPDANLAVLLLGLEHVRTGGWIVIEDISPDAVPIWTVVAGLMGSGHETYLIRSERAFLFCVRRSHSAE